jgi:hypothetical protein
MTAPTDPTEPTTPTPDNTPALGELADEDDQLGWNREQHGTFAEHAAPDDAVMTVDADEYFEGESDA